MSAAQHQALVLSSVSFAEFVFYLCFLLPSRRTKFSVFAACNLFFVALMFGAVALLDLSGGRAEIMVAVMTEWPAAYPPNSRRSLWRAGLGCGRYWGRHQSSYYFRWALLPS